MVTDSEPLQLFLSSLLPKQCIREFESRGKVRMTLTYFLIQCISVAVIWPGCFSLKVLCSFPLLAHDACAGQHFSITVYTLCRAQGLFANQEAFHHLHRGPPSHLSPTPSHPIKGCLGRPGPFAVLRMSTMQQGTI